MANNLESYTSGVPIETIPKYPHFAVLVEENQTGLVDVGFSQQVITKVGVQYIWFEFEDELKEWIRLNTNVKFKAIQVCPFAVNVEITLIKGNN